MRRNRSRRQKYKVSEGLKAAMVFIGLPIIVFLLFRFLPLFKLSSNVDSKPSVDFTIFITLSPLDKDQFKLSYDFLQIIDKNLTVSNTGYELKGICGSSLEYIDTIQPSRTVQPHIILETSFNWLSEIKMMQEKGETKCLESPVTSLKSYFNILNEYLVQNSDKNLVVFLQFPWKNSLKEKDYSMLEKELEKVKNKSRIKKFYLFGVSDQKASKLFSSFNKQSPIVVTSGISISSILTNVKKAKKIVRDDPNL